MLYFVNFNLKRGQHVGVSPPTKWALEVELRLSGSVASAKPSHCFPLMLITVGEAPMSHRKMHSFLFYLGKIVLWIKIGHWDQLIRSVFNQYYCLKTSFHF